MLKKCTQSIEGCSNSYDLNNSTVRDHFQPEVIKINESGAQQAIIYRIQR